MKNIRFRDLFWIRISLLDDPAFAAGAPWRIAPWVYDRLEAAGLVEKRVTPRGTPYAVGTDLARAYVSKRDRLPRYPLQGLPSGRTDPMTTREDILSLAVPEGWVRNELERMARSGDLPIYEMADDRGLDMDEYVKLISTVLAAAPTLPAAEAPGQEPSAVEIECVANILRTHKITCEGESITLGEIIEAAFGDADAEQAGSLVLPTLAKAAILAMNRPTPPTYADAEAKGWQTMDSAPLDGSRVDLWLDWPAHDDKPARQERSPDAFYDRITGDWVLLNHWFLGQYAAKPMATHWRRSQAGPAAIRSLASPAPKPPPMTLSDYAAMAQASATRNRFYPWGTST